MAQDDNCARLHDNNLERHDGCIIMYFTIQRDNKKG